MNAAWLRFLPSSLRDKADGRRHLQQAIGNTGWLLIDRTIRIFIGLVIGILMARVLGPAQFGRFNYALAFVALFSSIATLGLDGIIVRNLVNRSENGPKILGSAFVLKVTGALVAILLVTLSICFLEPESAQIQLLVAILAVGLIFQAFDVIDFQFQSDVVSKNTVIAKLPVMLSFSVINMLLIIGGFSLVFLAWTQTIELMFAAIGLMVVYQYTGNRVLVWRPEVSYGLVLLKESWPLILAGISVMLYMRIDIVMLGKISGDGEVGLYSAASRVSEGFYFLPMIITSSVAPMLLRARVESAVHYRQSLLKLYIVMVRLSAMIAITLTIAAPFVIDLLFGEGYVKSAGILRVHAWAGIPVFLGVASSQYLNNEGEQKLALYRTLIGLSVNIILNLLLIPDYGAMGAAIATLISYFVATFSIVINRSGVEQGRLFLRAMSPALVFGVKAI